MNINRDMYYDPGDEYQDDEEPAAGDGQPADCETGAV